MVDKKARKYSEVSGSIPPLPKPKTSVFLEGKTFVLLGIRDHRKSSFGESTYLLIDIVLDGVCEIWATGAYRIEHDLEALEDQLPVEVTLVREGKEWLFK